MPFQTERPRLSADHGHQSVSASDHVKPQSPYASGTIQRALSNPHLLQPNDILSLQRTIGNRATANLLRPSSSRLEVRPANDAYEQEADQISRQVMAGGHVAEGERPLAKEGIQRVPVSVIQRAFGKKKKKLNPNPLSDDDKDYINPDDAIVNRPTDDYRLTIGVLRSHPKYLKLQEARFKSTVRNKLRARARAIGLPGVRKERTTQEIKEKSAKKIVAPMFAPHESDEFGAEWKSLRDSGYGHSWVRLSKWAGGAPQEYVSFGFVFETRAPRHPRESVPGDVDSPDRHDDSPAPDDAEKLYIDYHITHQGYLKALHKALKIQENPPNYQTFGYNCTKFAHDITKAAGAPFPGKAKVVPASPFSGFARKVYSPNSLFAGLQDLSKIPGGPQPTQEPSTRPFTTAKTDAPKPVNPFGRRWKITAPLATKDASDIPMTTVKPGEFVRETGVTFPPNEYDETKVQEVEIRLDRWEEPLWVSYADLVASGELDLPPGLNTESSEPIPMTGEDDL